MRFAEWLTLLYLVIFVGCSCFWLQEMALACGCADDFVACPNTNLRHQITPGAQLYRAVATLLPTDGLLGHLQQMVTEQIIVRNGSRGSYLSMMINPPNFNTPLDLPANFHNRKYFQWDHDQFQNLILAETLPGYNFQVEMWIDHDERPSHGIFFIHHAPVEANRRKRDEYAIRFVVAKLISRCNFVEHQG